tara:strand:+ start:510 stop:701 length:192 start_codon:yes stop_codon:yes gene_type:complete
MVNRIGSSLLKINDVEGLIKQTNRIHSSVTITGLIQRITHTLLLTDNSDFLISDGSKLKVQTQ